MVLFPVELDMPFGYIPVAKVPKICQTNKNLTRMRMRGETGVKKYD